MNLCNPGPAPVWGHRYRKIDKFAHKSYYFIELQAKLRLEEDETDLSVRLTGLQSRFANQMENFDLYKISETKL